MGLGNLEPLGEGRRQEREILAEVPIPDKPERGISCGFRPRARFCCDPTFATLFFAGHLRNCIVTDSESEY